MEDESVTAKIGIVIPSQGEPRTVTTDDNPEISSTNVTTNGLVDVHGIDEEIARRNAEATEDIVKGIDGPGDLTASLTCFSHPDPLYARTNTPTGTFSTEQHMCKKHSKVVQNVDRRDSAMYRQAMTLMKERCSTAGVGDSTPTSARTRQKYFYVHQYKPTPMPPLQAWRGYNGNVYFEPIKVHPAGCVTSQQHQQQAPRDNHSDQLRDILKGSRRARSSRGQQTVNKDAPDIYKPQAKSMTNMTMRNSARSSNSNSPRPPWSRKMSVLDKKKVFEETNDNIHEDIIWILGQESTGSLCLASEADCSRLQEGKLSQHRPNFTHHRNNLIQQKQPPRQVSSAQQREKNLDKEKICRGSVAHKIYAMKNKNMPFLSVTGDKYNKQQLPSSPLLRTQTQYSHSNQRCLNTPDIFAGLDKLPPLEQLRASLKHIEPDTQGNLTHVMSPLDRIQFEDTDAITKRKPFVKYSPEVKNSAKLRNRQTSQRQQVM